MGGICKLPTSKLPTCSVLLFFFALTSSLPPLLSGCRLLLNRRVARCAHELSLSLGAETCSQAGLL